MNAQEIYQKRIEEAAHQYIQSDAVAPENMQLAFGDFINGAKFTLENLWISVDESLPEQNRNVLALNLSGDVFVAFHDGMQTWWWCDGFICGEKANGDKMYSSYCEIDSITHWMPIPSLKGGEK